MTMECYFSQCPHHDVNNGYPDDGPFCGLEECLASEEDIERWKEEERKRVEALTI